jgi:hypothetical protein
MSNVIDFLERMGQDADLRFAATGKVEQAMLSAQISPELRAAIIAGDQKKIEILTGAKTNVCAIIYPVETDDRDLESANQLKSKRAAG